MTENTSTDNTNEILQSTKRLTRDKKCKKTCNWQTKKMGYSSIFSIVSTLISLRWWHFLNVYICILKDIHDPVLVRSRPLRYVIYANISLSSENGVWI